MKKILRYKFLRKGMKSENGNLKWEIGKWNKTEGQLSMCSNGLHACKEPYWAFSYIRGEILALVECKGKHLVDDNKECWQEQRVIKAWKWTKKDSVKLAIFSAEQVIDIYEKKYPQDKRPRKAIETAKKWLKNPTAKNRACAASYAADAAYASYDAAYASYAAAYASYAAAYAAAYASYAAAYAAADAAADAAYASYDAASYAYTRKKLITKICKYFMKLVKELKPYGRN